MNKTSHTHISTAYGTRIDLIDPQPSQFDIHSIAVSLGRQCRFNGNVLDQHYSVAQHSVYVSQLVPRHMALAALLHDASEVATGDIVSPLKRLLGPALSEVEDRVQAAIHEAFGLPSELPMEWQEQIHLADMQMVVAEKHQLHLMLKERWDIEDHYEPANIQITRMEAHEATVTFLTRFWNLSPANSSMEGP